jgi:hypothetical protein
MKRIFIVQSGYQDGPEVFTTPKKAYDFIVKSCRGMSENMPPYKNVLKEVKANIKTGNIQGWQMDEYGDNNPSITIKELNPQYYY